MEIFREKEEDLTQSCDKSPQPQQKNPLVNTKRHKKLRLHNECGYQIVYISLNIPMKQLPRVCRTYDPVEDQKSQLHGYLEISHGVCSIIIKFYKSLHSTKFHSLLKDNFEGEIIIDYGKWIHFKSAISWICRDVLWYGAGVCLSVCLSAKLKNMIQTEPFHLGPSTLVHILLMTRRRTVMVFKIMGQRSRSHARHCC